MVTCYSLKYELSMCEPGFRDAIMSFTTSDDEISLGIALLLAVAPLILVFAGLHLAAWFFPLVSKRLRKGFVAARAYWVWVTQEPRYKEQAGERKSNQSEHGRQQGQEQQDRRDHSYKSESTAVPNEDWCYRLLGVTPRATLEEINRAYRHKAKMHHPDHKGDGDVMRMLNEAVQILRELHAAK